MPRLGLSSYPDIAALLDKIGDRIAAIEARIARRGGLSSPGRAQWRKKPSKEERLSRVTGRSAEQNLSAAQPPKRLSLVGADDRGGTAIAGLEYLRRNPALAGVVIAGGAILVVGGAYIAARKLSDQTEKPHYDTVRQDADIEVRDYDAMLIAETVESGYHEKAREAGFETLFDYIRGRNRSGGKISMTAPVLQQLAEHDGRAKGWAIRFVMPRRYDRSTLPTPSDRDVIIREVPAKRVVAISFSGRFSASLASKKLMEIYDYLGDENLRQKGDPEYAFYDPPWTPGFMRRNEILIEIER